MLQCKYANVQPSKIDKMFEEIAQSLQQLTQHHETLMTKVETLEARLDRLDATPSPTQSADHLELSKLENLKLLQTAQSPTTHTTHPYEVLRRWPSLPPLLRGANIDINSMSTFRLEPCGSSWTSDCNKTDTLVQRMDNDPANSNHRHRRACLAEGCPTEQFRCLSSCPNAPSIRSLVKSYEKHIHILQPFLDRIDLHTLRDRFISWEGTLLSECDHPLKRRRTDESVGDLNVRTTSESGGTISIDQRLEHALIYVVLALGSVCANEESSSTLLCDASSDSVAPSVNMDIVSNVWQTYTPVTRTKREPTDAASNPICGAGYDTSQAEFRTGTTPSDTENQSYRCPAHVCLRPPGPSPGGEDYAKAKHILEACAHGDKLLLAQIHLLMGLYNGQFTFGTESMKWYSGAGRLLLSLLDRYNLCNDGTSADEDVESTYHRTQGRIKDKRHNLVVLASWACLQLEGDILADYDLPTSGIQNVQHLLPLPLDLYDMDGTRASTMGEASEAYEPRGNVSIHFAAQSFLSKQLNLFREQFHGLNRPDRSLMELQGFLSSHRTILDHWRAQLPENLQWSDSHLPSPNILSANLQARYWNAQYIVSRPYLDYALHVLPHVGDGRNVEEVALDVFDKSRSTAEIQAFKTMQLLEVEEVWRACQRCLEAAARSTTAFDGIAGRLVVNNIHGTALTFVD